MSEDFIPDVVLADNTSQRLPCVLVLVGSGSMGGEPINELNKGLKLLEQELKNDDTAAQRVQLMVIRLGDDNAVQILTDWTDALDFSAPVVNANGTTPLGVAMETALDAIEEQKENYRENSIPYNRPWIFLITDGMPTDLDWEASAAHCRDAEDEGKAIIFTIGTADADFDALKKFSSRSPVRLDGLKFKELFLWLSRSAASGSKVSQDTEIQIEAPDAWGTIQT